MRAMPPSPARPSHAAIAPNAPAAGGLAAVALFAAGGHLGIELVSNFLPIVYPILVAEAGFSFAQVGTVTLVATLGMTLPQPLLGLVVKRYAAGRLVLLAVVWCGLFYGARGTDAALPAAAHLGGPGRSRLGAVPPRRLDGGVGRAQPAPGRFHVDFLGGRERRRCPESPADGRG